MSSRLGPSVTPARALGGGHANLNVELDDGSVLRVFERDAQAITKEARLLRARWQSFRVPGVLSSGDDFLVLEGLTLHPVPSDGTHGRAIGRALGEIHSRHISVGGDLARHLEAGFTLARARDYVAEVGGQLGHPWQPRVRRTLAALEAACGRDPDTTEVLLHGDFKTPNLFRDENGEVVVLDWEFACIGSRYFDFGQLFRWGSSPDFRREFARGYGDETGTALPNHWHRQAEVADLVNLWDLLARTQNDDSRLDSLRKRIDETLARM